MINMDKYWHDLKNLLLEYRQFQFGVADTRFRVSL